ELMQDARFIEGGTSIHYLENKLAHRPRAAHRRRLRRAPRRNGSTVHAWRQGRCASLFSR
ncbi:MAG: hypothetical protein EOO27_16260, partial [Comamonadaceae bacterium]